MATKTAAKSTVSVTPATFTAEHVKTTTRYNVFNGASGEIVYLPVDTFTGATPATVEVTAKAV